MSGPYDDVFGVGDFADAEAQAHGDVQDAFGEAFIHMPVVPPKPNYPSTQLDPAREPYCVSAIFVGEYKNLKLGMEEGGVSSREPSITVRKSDLRWPVRKPDRFQRCATGEVFETQDIQRDSLSGVDVILKQCGRATG